MTKKKIMILGASILQLPAIQEAKKMGLQVIVADMDPDAIGFKIKGIVKELISTIDTESILKAAKKHNIDGIMTLATDMPMRTIAKVSKELHLVGIDEQTAFKATNKAAMRDALQKKKVPIPIYYKVTSKDEYNNAVNSIRRTGARCIIKPADNSGSRGIVLLRDFAEKTIDESYNYSKKYSRSGELMVEEYMSGPEVSVETISINGTCHVIQITDKMTTGEPNFVEMGHSQPSRLSDNTKEEIIKVTIAANQAIGIKNGPSHTEIIITKSGPKIVELGARLGGDNITTKLVPLSTGVNMVKCCIEIALGKVPNIDKTINMGSAIRYMKTESGTIKNIYGIEDAKVAPGIKDIFFTRKIGDTINDIKNSSDRIGFIIAQGNTADDAIKACANAQKIIRIEMEPANDI